MARRILLISFMLILAFALAGCGGSDPASSEEARQTQQTQDQTKAPAEADQLLLEVNDQILEVELEENEAAEALAKLAGEDGLKLDLTEYGGFEKVGQLPQSLPASDQQIDTSPGDIVLYQGDQISLFYGENSWSYTRLGHMKGVSAGQLQDLLGDGDISVTLKKSE